MHKLSYCGVKGIAYSLIQSYLTQRKQVVNIKVANLEKITTESHRVR